MKKTIVTCDYCRTTIPCDDWGSVQKGFSLFGLIRDANGKPILKDEHTYRSIDSTLCSLKCLKEFVSGIKIPKK